ncbi:RAMP superfamily CRISPR-associated protein [Stappia sp.]|uniref:RAMP superfamily CRISPR-associated protein n=1 Tax=Stappia sp. TaxID=1870903 RepID=UPI003D0D5401
MKLIFRILSFWQVGTGAGEMGIFDERPIRDHEGLPFIPGRQVKGLCRQAVRDAEVLGCVSAGTADVLFGARAEPGKPLLDDPDPGVLRFDDARLPVAERQALVGRHKLISGLYRTRRSTAMTEDGVARPHSLRFEEVAIPLTLEAEVSRPDEADDEWMKDLEKVLPLIIALGSGRTRGMGRVIVTTGDER